MNKQEVVTKFLESGLLLKPQTLEGFTERDDIDSIINLNKSSNNTIVNLSTNTPITNTFNYKIKQSTTKEKITPKDFIEYYSKKFETLKNILIQKLDAVSINNLQQEKESCIIGMVGDKTNRGFYVEDQTGKIEAVHTEPQKQSFVLGFKGVFKDKTFFVKEVVYPDIPLSKQNTEPPKIILTTKQVNNTNTTISPNSKDKNDNLISNFSLPATINLTINNQQTTVLIFQPQDQINKTQAAQILKLRCLPETNTPNPNNIIEDTPDVFWLIQKEEWKENYKGVLIVSGEVVNL
ncbi:MAG TPA: hypothetical protein VJA47_03415 [archaeon]|nr:hypothetical protein [archaeon]